MLAPIDMLQVDEIFWRLSNPIPPGVRFNSNCGIQQWLVVHRPGLLFDVDRDRRDGTGLIDLHHVFLCSPKLANVFRCRSAPNPETPSHPSPIPSPLSLLYANRRESTLLLLLLLLLLLPRPLPPPVGVQAPSKEVKEEPPVEAKVGDLVELFMGKGQVRAIRDEDGMLEVWAMGWEMAGEQRPRYFVQREAVKVVKTVYYQMPGTNHECGCG